jgi:hypothetical protein
VLEVFSEAVLQPLHRLLREHIVARGRIGRRKHGIGNLEDFVFVAGSCFHESVLPFHNVQAITYVEAIILLEPRNAYRPHKAAGSLKRLGRLLHGRRDSESIGPKPGSTNQPTRSGLARLPPLCRTGGGPLNSRRHRPARGEANAMSRTLRAIGPTCQKRRGTRGQSPVIGMRPCVALRATMSVCARRAAHGDGKIAAETERRYARRDGRRLSAARPAGVRIRKPNLG